MFVHLLEIPTGISCFVSITLQAASMMIRNIIVYFKVEHSSILDGNCTVN